MEPKTKLVGLIGGTGWISTIEYYRIINTEINRRLGGLQFARCVLYSLNYGEIAALNQQNDLNGVYHLLQEAARQLINAGAACIVLCANTMHQFADRLQQTFTVPLIHIADATALAIKRQGLNKVGLLGTKPTMEMDFYHARLQAHHLETIVPDEAERDFIQHTIMHELLLGHFLEISRARFVEIMAQLHARGAEGIILGCTEIPLLIRPQDTQLPLFDTLVLHSQAVVDFALS